MRVLPRAIGLVGVSGCLLGVPSTKGYLGPVLDGEPTLVSPSEVADDGLVHVRAGVEVVVRVRTELPVDAEATTVTLDGYPMALHERVDDRTLLYALTLQGDEGSSPKSISGRLRDRPGEGGLEARFASSAPVLVTDFTPPSAACVLSPRVANATDRVTLVVTPSEPLLGGPPQPVSSASGIAVQFRETVEGQHVYDVSAPPGTNVDSYTLRLTATDRAGNPQQGDSLCADPATRTGTLLGRGPKVASGSDVEISATASVRTETDLWVRDGAVVTVVIPTDEALDAAESTVVLSGLEAVHDAAASTPVRNVWTLPISAASGEGRKDLDARLVDAAGNSLRVQREGAVRVDTVAPRAGCVLQPRSATASDNVRFQVFASEALTGGIPTVSVSDPRVLLGPPTTIGNEHTFPVSASAGDVVYTFEVTGTDLAGNPQQGASFCDEANRSGRIIATAPEVLEPVRLTATPGGSDPVVKDGNTPRLRAGARITVEIPTAAPIRPAASVVKLSGMALTHVPGLAEPNTWTRTLDGTEGEGLKTLDARLVDEVGNTTTVLSADLQDPVQVDLDFTPPSASCVLAPHLAAAATRVDFQVIASEPLAGGRPTVTVDTPAVSVSDAGTLDNQHLFTLALTQSDVRVDDYVLTVTAADRVGNVQSSASLCDLADRTGTFDGTLPTLTNLELVVDGPSVQEGDGSWRAGIGAKLTLRGTPSEPLDPKSTRISLSGIELTRVGAQDGAWTTTLTGAEGDGLKSLDLVLVDEAGNRSAVQRPDLHFIADFTAPQVVAALLQRSPTFGPADPDGHTVRFSALDPLTREATRATVSLDANERLTGTPTLIVSGTALGFGTAALSGPRATWTSATVGQSPAGASTFRARLTDEVGNSAERDLPLTLVVDHTGPAAAPDVATPDRIVHARVPWGSKSTEGQPSHTVSGLAGAVEAHATVVLRTELGTPVASTRADASGAFTRVALPADQSALFIEQLDDAGNPSPRARVRDVTWTATLGGKKPGRDVDNPHDFVHLARQGPTLDVDGQLPLALTASDVVALIGEDGTPATVQGEATWDDMTSSPTGPTARWGAVSAYDSARGVTVVFGGSGATTVVLRDVWEWDGVRWTDRTASSGPSARQLAAMAYDAARGEVVLFGGYGTDAATRFSDTWTWDGVAWTERSTTVHPTGRAGHAMAYDSARGRVVLFGGSDNNNRLGDTWEWDGSTWTQILPVVAPAARTYHAMAYDSRRREIVLWSGSASPLRADTWVWNGATWTEVTPASVPPATEWSRLVDDEGRGQLVLVGGLPSTGPEASDTWTWSNRTWTKVPADTRYPNPPGRADLTLAYDRARAEVVLFGGRSGTSRLDDTWVLGDRGWELRTLQSPSPRVHSAMVYDEEREEFILFGGEVAGPGVSNETWIWHEGWTRRTPSVKPNTARHAHALAYDHVRKQTLLFGGEASGDLLLGETWLWDGATWASKTTAAGLAPRRSHAMATLPGGDVVLMGGIGASNTYLADVWLWGGASWSPLTAGPSARHGHAMGLDAQSSALLLFGGLTSPTTRVGDTWRRSGTTWSQQSTTGGPEARNGARMAYDHGRAELLLYAGDGASLQDDLWAWDRTARQWVAREARETPGPRRDHALASDPHEQVLLLFGGGTDSTPLGDTWRFDSGANQRPGQRFSVDLQEAEPEDAAIVAVTARWWAGGEGYPSGIVTPGAELLVWDEGQWKGLTTNTAGPTSPTELCWSLRNAPDVAAVPSCTNATSAAQLARLFVGEARTLHVAARTLATSGPGHPTDPLRRHARLASDYVEVTVRYRLPPG